MNKINSILILSLLVSISCLTSRTEANISAKKCNCKLNEGEVVSIRSAAYPDLYLGVNAKKCNSKKHFDCGTVYFTKNRKSTEKWTLRKAVKYNAWALQSLKYNKVVVYLAANGCTKENKSGCGKIGFVYRKNDKLRAWGRTRQFVLVHLGGTRYALKSNRYSNVYLRFYKDKKQKINGMFSKTDTPGKYEQFFIENKCLSSCSNKQKKNKCKLKNGSVATIRSVASPKYFLGAKAKDCKVKDKTCGKAFVTKKQGTNEKWILHKMKNGVWTLKNKHWKNAILSLDSKSCKKYTKNGCGKVNFRFTKKKYNGKKEKFYLVKIKENIYALKNFKYSKSYLRIDPKNKSINSQFLKKHNPGKYEQFYIETECDHKHNAEFFANKYSPILYFKSGEPYFPVSFKDLKINWKGVSIKDKKYPLKYDFNAGKTFNRFAPYYTYIKKESDHYKIYYAIVYAYNACGPKVKITARVKTLVLNVGISNLKISVCPAGVHNGDIENIMVKLSRDWKFKSVNYSYHAWDETFKKNQIEWEHGHPVAFSALGSHAVYRKAGEVSYNPLWNKRSGKTLKCLRTCYKKKKIPYICGIRACSKFGIKYPCDKWCDKTISIPYPCTKKCFVGAETSGDLIDQTADDIRFNGPVRIIKSNCYKLPYKLTKDEKNMNKFKGRFGFEVKNNGWKNLKKIILVRTFALRKVCSSCNKEIKKTLKTMESHYESRAPSSLASKDWWK